MGLLDSMSEDDQARLAGLLFSLPDKYGNPSPMAALGQYFLNAPERKKQMELQEAQRKQMEAQTATLGLQNQGLQDVQLAAQNRLSLQQAMDLSGPVGGNGSPVNIPMRAESPLTQAGKDALDQAMKTQDQSLLSGALMSGNRGMFESAQGLLGQGGTDENWYGNLQSVLMPDKSVKLFATSNRGNNKAIDFGGGQPMIPGSFQDIGDARVWASNRNVPGMGAPQPSIGQPSTGMQVGSMPIQPSPGGGLSQYLAKGIPPQDQPSLKQQQAGAMESAKNAVTEIGKSYETLANAPVVLRNIEDAKRLVGDAKNFVGKFGENKLGLIKALNNNLGTNIDASGVNSAEELRARLGLQVVENLRKMDPTPTIQQQLMLARIMGGLDTDPNALPQLLDAYGGILRQKVAIHNNLVDETQKAGFRLPPGRMINLEMQSQGKKMTAADLEATARASGKSLQEIIQAAKARGYQVEGY